MTAEQDLTEPDEERLVGSDRVLAVLMELAEHPSGITLDDITKALKSSKPTVHRALAALRKAGLAVQSARGVYVLGDEFLRLAFRFHDQRPESTRMEPLLRELANEYGETTHYAVLDGVDVVYRAKVNPAHGAVRLTSTIGGRNPSHCTAVGKMLLSYIIESEADLRVWLGSTSLEARTPNSITTPTALWAELECTKERRYAIDDQENEVGVVCVALPVFLDTGAAPSGAVSVSAVAFRRPLDSLIEALPRMRAAIDRHLGSR